MLKSSTMKSLISRSCPVRALLLVAAIAGALAHQARHENGSLPFSCGTHSPEGEVEMRRLATPRHSREAVHAIFLRGRKRRSLQSSREPVITLPTMVYHVVRSSDGVGALTNAQLDAQHDALVAAFQPYIQFGNWERRDYVDDVVYSQGCSDTSIMRAFQLENADVTKLNSYFIDCISSSLFGYAYLPYSFPENSPYHGAILDSFSIDGSVCFGGCEGDTGVHEWGHAFGLLHTFESQLSSNDRDEGCDCTWGDLVDDTPPEAEPAYGGGRNCAAHAQRNTCTDDDQNDPVTNFMDYSDDLCLATFTDGQFYRMLYQLALEKPNLLSIALGDGVNGECFPGTHWNGTQCIVCPAGTYQDDFGQTECKSCPVDFLESIITGSDGALGDELVTHENQCFQTGVADNCIDQYLGDGWCDAQNNNEECLYDLGDCCAECCDPNASLVCGSGDPSYQNFARCEDSTCVSSQSEIPFDYVLRGEGECARFIFGGNFSDEDSSENVEGQVEAEIGLLGPSFGDEVEEQNEFLSALLTGMLELLSLNSSDITITGSLSLAPEVEIGRATIGWLLSTRIVIPYSYLVNEGLATEESDPSLIMGALRFFTCVFGVEDGSYELEVEEAIEEQLVSSSSFAGFTSPDEISTSIAVDDDATVSSGLATDIAVSSANLIARTNLWALLPAMAAIFTVSRVFCS